MSFDFIFTLLRKMFFNIDRIIYGLIDDVYGLVIQLAGTSIFSTEMINAFAERIYAFIGIFMLFKVTISLITHVLNPDDFTDKEKGFTSIIKRIILSLCMVVLVPYVFAEAYHFQKLILTENTLVTLIFGTPPDTNGEVAQLAGTTYVDTAGKKMQFTLMNAFIHPNYEEFTITSSDEKKDFSACRELYVKDSNGNFKFRNRVGSDTKTSRYYYALNPACFGEYDSSADKYTGEYTAENGTKKTGLYEAFAGNENAYQTYAQGVAQQNYDLMFRQNIVELSIDDKYVMDYKYLISTVAGVVTLYMLVVFCIDIAVRSVKLGFLQMIAPIPIISYVDPKSGKDGMFKKWTNMCVKTYLDLFIRLFALFFGIYIISLIGTFKDVMDGETISDGIVNVFLIIGVLIFVKKLPEILKETLGFEGGTFKDFKINPLKRIENDALFGKPAAAVLGSPISGAGLFGRKMIAGIDSARNGGGFTRGFNSVHGKLHNNFYKKLDEWAPDSAESRKNREKGIKEQEQRVNRENIGRPFGTAVNNSMDATARTYGYADGDDWKKDNYSAFARAKAREEIKHFKHDEYRRSYLHLQETKIQQIEKDKKAREVNDKYQAFLSLSTGQTISIGGTTYAKGTDDQAILDLRDSTAASASSAAGKVEAAKNAHQSVKLKYGDDAEREQAYDEYGKAHDWTAGAPGHSGSWS